MRRTALLLAVLEFAADREPRIAIREQAIAAHMRFLASDLLEGRETGTRGYDIAADYVAAQFAAIGLRTEFQTIVFRAALLNEDQSSFAVSGQSLTIRKEVILRPNFLEPTTEVSAPAVFVGFGVTAPELHHDDYAAVDVRGKLVLMLSGAPPRFPADQRAFYSGSRLKEKTAAAHGAVSVLTLNTITDEKRYPFEKRVQQSSIPPMLYLEAGRPADAVEGIRASAWMSRAAAEKLFAGAPLAVDTVLTDAEKSIAHSFPLQATVAVRTTSTFTERKSVNVIGVLPGAEREAVVLSAHLDHLGNHPPPDGGDAIYNGAYDNASGIACLIEIARACRRTKRSIVFVAFTGEEKGDQGSEYFVRHPKGTIVANVNMDMFLMLYPVGDLVALGGEHSSLGELATRAAHDSGFEMSPDPYPEEVRFIRSDQFSFVEEGIPAIHLKPGNKSRDPRIDGATATRDWLRRIYHTPADDMNQKIDFASGARYAEANLRLARAIANAPERPRWKPGDFFAPK